jgi:serine/threonine-protein kinase
MECLKCHTPLPDGSKFCHACGADQTGGDAAATSGQIEGLLGRLQKVVEGKYTIERILGKGGMGAVYLAHDLALDREVAIKVLPPDISQDPQVVRRFQQEAKTAAKLDHNNIIPIYRVESEGGLNYFVMKYISGTSLEDLLEQKRPLAIDEIQRILWQAAVALGHAHQRRIVHRDVKPANIMFDHDGKVMLTDFGISKALQAASGFTGTGMIIGTPHYMAPEQAKGQPVDGRADQYSLGVVGYRMITGALPFSGDSIHTILYKHIFEEPPQAKSVRADVPDFLSLAIHRSLAKEPAQRFPTMEDFATALLPEQPVHAGTSVPGGPTTPHPRAGRPPVTSETPTELSVAATTPMPSAGKAMRPVPQKKKSRGGLAVAAVVVLALGVGGYLMFGRPRSAPATDTPTQGSNAPPSGNPVVGGHTDSLGTPAQQTAQQTPPQTSTPSPTPRHPAGRRQTTRQAPPPSTGGGFISVATDPIATVYIDGASAGQSPVIGWPVGAGTHTIKVDRVGYTSQTLTITVAAGATVVKRLTLIPGG